MPYINLGNILSSSERGSQYTYHYNAGTKTHILSGKDQFGFCYCLNKWHPNDSVIINNIKITEINQPEKIQAWTWIQFIVDNNKMYIFNKTAHLLEVPDGTIIEPINDIAIWCACADLDWYNIGCPSINTLLTSGKYKQLFTNSNAFAYLKRSNQLLAKALSNTSVYPIIEEMDYWSSVYVIGTGSPEGYATATSNACYNDTKWKAHGAFAYGVNYLTSGTVTGNYQWCQLQIPEYILPYKMTIIPSTSSYPHNATVIWQCSPDGIKWYDLDSQKTITTSSPLYTFYNKIGFTEKCNLFRLTLADDSSNDYWEVTQGRVHGFL